MTRTEVHATVRTFEPLTAFTDTGEVLEIPRFAFEVSGLRLLRPGQRVRIVSEGGTALFVTIATLPDPL